MYLPVYLVSPGVLIIVRCWDFASPLFVLEILGDDICSSDTFVWRKLFRPCSNFTFFFFFLKKLLE